MRLQCCIEGPGRSRPAAFWRLFRPRSLGFGALAGTLAVIAKVLLFVFLALFVISLIFGRGRGAIV